jgi:hypothetical protein
MGTAGGLEFVICFHDRRTAGHDYIKKGEVEE